MPPPANPYPPQVMPGMPPPANPYPPQQPYPQQQSYPQQYAPQQPYPPQYSQQAYAPQPVAQHASPQPPQPQKSPIQHLRDAVNTFREMTNVVSEFRNVAQEGTDDEIGPANPLIGQPSIPESSLERPFEVMTIGQGPEAVNFAYNRDGSPHWLGTLVGNSHKIQPLLSSFEKLAARAVAAGQGQSPPAQSPQVITVQAHEQPPQHAPQQMPATPPPRNGAIMPTVAELRRAQAS